MSFRRMLNGGPCRAKPVAKGCPLCGALPLRPRFVWTDPDWGHYQVARCPSCGVDYTDRPFADRTMQEDEGYWGSVAVYEGLVEANVDEARDYLAAITPFADRGRLLDIGCGYGYFIEVAHRAGFDAHGFDVSPLAIQHAAARVGADRVRVAITDSARWQPESFDVITLWNVIEHMGTPGHSLARIVSWLKPGGILVIETPNRDSLVRRIGALMYRLSAGRLGLVAFLHASREGGHVQIFSAATLEAALAHHGLCVVASQRLNSPTTTLLAKNVAGNRAAGRVAKRAMLLAVNAIARATRREARIRLVLRRDPGAAPVPPEHWRQVRAVRRAGQGVVGVGAERCRSTVLGCDPATGVEDAGRGAPRWN